MLIPALSSKAALKIIYLFSLEPGKGLNRKEIKEFTKLENNPLDRALKLLVFFSVLERQKRIYRLKQNKELLEFLKAERERSRNINFDVWNLLFDFSLAMERFKPKRMILFGSYAKAVASVHSDVDVCLVFEKKDLKEEIKIHELAEELEKKFEKKLQLQFFSEKDFEGNAELVKEIKRDGIDIVYSR